MQISGLCRLILGALGGHDSADAAGTDNQDFSHVLSFKLCML